MAFFPSLKREVKKADGNKAFGRRFGYTGYSGDPYQTQWNIDRAIDGAMRQNVWAFRAVHAIAQNAAGLPAIIRDGNQWTGELVENHPLLPLLNFKPNQWQDSWAWRYTLSTQILLNRRGAFIQVIRSRRGDVIALYLIPPGTITPIPDVVNFVSGYEVQQENQKTILKPEEVVWIKLPHPSDPYDGMTPLEAAGLAVETDILAKTYNRNFLQNDGRPGGILAIKGGMEDDEAEVLRQRFMGSAINGGVQGAGRLTVLETGDQGVDFVDTATTPRDAQWVDMKKSLKEEILIAYGVPEAVIGNASGRCVDAETEALTQRGWLSGDEITTDDIILSMDPKDGRFKWSPIHEVYRAHYKGDMYRIKNTHVDFLVTPGHNWAVKPRPGQGRKSLPTTDAFVLKAVEDLGENDTILVTGLPENSVTEIQYSSAFVELVGWSVTEGCFDRPSYIRLCQNEGVNANRIRKALYETDALWTESQDSSNPKMVRFYLRGEVALAVTTVAPNRVMKPEFLVALTPEQRELLLDTMMEAEASFPNNSKSEVFGQKDMAAAEVFQMLVTLTGRRSSTRLYKWSYQPPIWRVIVGVRKVMTVRRNARKLEQYDGMVWCPRTDYGTFVMRRHGRVVVTGNTFDNAGVETEVFWRETTLPHLNLIARGLDVLTPEDNRFVAFDMSSVYVLDRDKREQHKYYLEEFKAGAVSADEYLTKTGQHPIGDDHRYIMNNLVPYGPDGNPDFEAAPALPAAPRDAMAPDPPTGEGDPNKGDNPKEPTLSLVQGGKKAGWVMGPEGPTYRFLTEQLEAKAGSDEKWSIERSGRSWPEMKFKEEEQDIYEPVQQEPYEIHNGIKWTTQEEVLKRAAELAAQGVSTNVIYDEGVTNKEDAGYRRNSTIGPSSAPTVAVTQWGGKAVDASALERHKALLGRRLDSWEQTAAKNLSGFFERQERVVLKRLQDHKSLKAPNLIDRKRWDKELTEDTDAWLRQVYEDFGSATAKELGTSFDLSTKGAQAVLEAQKERVALMNQDTANNLGQLLVRATESNWDRSELLAEAGILFKGYIDFHANTIAVREVTAAASAGVLIAGLQSADENITKIWTITNCSALHHAIDGQERKISEPFIVGDEELMFPGDPSASIQSTANCRCGITLAKDGQIVMSN